MPSRFHRGEVQRREAEQREMQRREAEQREVQRREAEQREVQRREAEQREVQRREAERREVQRREAEQREVQRREDAATALKALMYSNDEAALEAALLAGQEVGLQDELLEQGVLRLSELQLERREAPAPLQPVPLPPPPAAPAAPLQEHVRPREGLSNALRAGAAPAEVTVAYLAACTDGFAWAKCGLGEGAFGRVYRGVDAESGARFAVKMLKDDIVDGRADAAVLAAMHRAAAQEVMLSEFRLACMCPPRRPRPFPHR